MLEDIYRRYFKVENDYFYRKGYEAGLEEVRQKRRMGMKMEYARKMKDVGLESELIAKVLELPIRKIKKI